MSKAGGKVVSRADLAKLLAVDPTTVDTGLRRERWGPWNLRGVTGEAKKPRGLNRTGPISPDTYVPVGTVCQLAR